MNMGGEKVKIKKYILPVLAVILIISIFIFSLLSEKTKDVTVSDFAMGSPVNVTVYGEKNGDEHCNLAIKRIKFIDNSYLSHTVSSSAVYTLNEKKTLISDMWFADYLENCVELSKESDSFTLFSGEFKDLWKIENGGYVPTDDEIAKVLDSHKNASLSIDSNSISLNSGKLDLGALGKGTACDEAIKVLQKRNVSNALVTVGGTVGVIGSPDGVGSYSIGIRNPFGSQIEYFAILNVTDCFVSTSGDYEKYFECDGVRYSHIFDAKTARPVQSDITAVTVVADNGTLSDFLSTVIFIEGVEKGFEIADEFDAEILIVKKDKSVLVSEELNDKLTIRDNSFSVSVIE